MGLIDWMRGDKAPQGSGIKNWIGVSGDKLTPEDLNALIQQNRTMFGLAGVREVESVRPLKSGWFQYFCRMRVDDEGDVMKYHFYIKPTAHDLRNTAPLIMDWWTYGNSGLSKDPQGPNSEAPAK